MESKHKQRRLTGFLWFTVLLFMGCAGEPLSDQPGRRPSLAVDTSLISPDPTTAIAWVEQRSGGQLFVVGKVFGAPRTASLARAPKRTLVGPVGADFRGVENSFGLTLTRIPSGYFLTWSDDGPLFGQFWNETLSGTRSELIALAPRASAPPAEIEAVYDPHRRRILLVWRSDRTLFSGTISAERRMLIRTGVRLASRALHFDIAANLKRSASPAFLVSYITGSDLLNREVRSFTLSGPALGVLTKSAESVLTTSTAPTVYEIVSVSFNNPFNGFVTAFTRGEQIEAVAQDHVGSVERRYDLGSRRVFWRRLDGGRSIRHPEHWYDLDCPINPNGLAVILLTQTVESPTERFAELQLYARPVRGLGTDSGVTLGADVLLGLRSADLSSRLNFHGGVRAVWNGVFEIVWEQIVRTADLDTVLDQEVLFNALNARAEVVP